MHGLDKIVYQSLKYISDETKIRKIDVYMNYCNFYERKSLRHITKHWEFIGKDVDEKLKLDSLRATGRYCRMYAPKFKRMYEKLNQKE